MEELSSSNSAPLQDEVILALSVLAIRDNKLKFLSHPKAKLSLALCWYVLRPDFHCTLCSWCKHVGQQDTEPAPTQGKLPKIDVVEGQEVKFKHY